MANYVSNNIYESRTAGQRTEQVKTVQSWKSKNIAAKQPAQNIAQASPIQQKILQNLDKAAHGQVGAFDVQIDNSLAYANPNQAIETTPAPSEEGYQFHDVVDVINPLHHLPVVGMVYRGITGDELHPMSQIIGGAIYGGPVGAVSGTVNAISKIQTGKDLGDHAISFVGLGREQAEPIQQLNKTATALKNNQPLEELPASTLSFVNLSEPHHAHRQIKMASGRTAGHMPNASYKQVSTYNASQQSSLNTAIQAQEIAAHSLPKREEITQVHLSAMPPRRES